MAERLSKWVERINHLWPILAVCRSLRKTTTEREREEREREKLMFEADYYFTRETLIGGAADANGSYRGPV